VPLLLLPNSASQHTDKRTRAPDSQQLSAIETAGAVVVATIHSTSIPLSMTDVADMFRRHLELRVFVFGTAEPPHTNSCFANYKKLRYQTI
jgi:hypothetical protein